MKQRYRIKHYSFLFIHPFFSLYDRGNTGVVKGQNYISSHMHVIRSTGLTNLPLSDVVVKIRNWTTGTRITSDFDKMKKKGKKHISSVFLSF